MKIERPLTGMIDGESPPTIDELRSIMTGAKVLRSTVTLQSIETELEAQIAERESLLQEVREESGV